MPRGGRRQGTPGAAYSNRTDLALDRAPTSVGKVDPTAAGGQSAPATAAPAPSPQVPFTPPDGVPRLTDPSADGRPVTDGMPLGPGRGPESLGTLPSPSDNTLAILRDLYGKTGSEHIRRMIAQQQLMGS